MNCCTIDWFAEWPAEALYSVGKQQMTLEDLKLPNLEGLDVTDMDTTCALKKNEKDYLSYSDYFRLLVHVTCCKETATLPLWIQLMNFSNIVKMTILVARPSGAANLSNTAPWHNLQP